MNDSTTAYERVLALDDMGEHLKLMNLLYENINEINDLLIRAYDNAGVICLALQEHAASLAEGLLDALFEEGLRGETLGRTGEQVSRACGVAEDMRAEIITLRGHLGEYAVQLLAIEPVSWKNGEHVGRDNG